MSEGVQRDDHRLSFHDMVHFRYDEQCPALHAEGLSKSALYLPVLGHEIRGTLCM
jgi:hypothetical protein